MLKNTKLVFIFCAILVTESIFGATATQNSLSLYDQPDGKGKIIATIAAGQPLIPIFSQGEWFKVGDPNNGNVGWVNKTTLAVQGYPTLYVKTYGNKNQRGDVQSYQVVQYAGADSMDQKQMDTMLKNFQAQQVAFEKQMNQFMQQDFSNFKQIWPQPIIMPVLQPIILVPEKAPPTQAKKSG